MKRLACLLPTLALIGCTSAVTTSGGSGGTAISPERIAADIRTVSGDAFLGRAPATRGEELTTTYIRDRLQAAGVQAGGPNGSWFQEVPLSQSDIVGTPSLSITVGGQTTPLKQGEQIAVRA